MNRDEYSTCDQPFQHCTAERPCWKCAATPKGATVPPPPAVPGELIETAAAVRPHRCGRCDARWSGGRACHCAGCHETFTGLASFDYHRAGDECRDPRAVKKPMSLDGYGRWGWPETEGRVRGAVRRAQSDEQPDPAPAPVRDAEGPQNAVQGRRR